MATCGSRTGVNLLQADQAARVGEGGFARSEAQDAGVDHARNSTSLLRISCSMLERVGCSCVGSPCPDGATNTADMKLELQCRAEFEDGGFTSTVHLAWIPCMLPQLRRPARGADGHVDCAQALLQTPVTVVTACAQASQALGLEH